MSRPVDLSKLSPERIEGARAAVARVQIAKMAMRGKRGAEMRKTFREFADARAGLAEFTSEEIAAATDDPTGEALTFASRMDADLNPDGAERLRLWALR